MIQLVYSKHCYIVIKDVTCLEPKPNQLLNSLPKRLISIKEKYSDGGKAIKYRGIDCSKKKANEKYIFLPDYTICNLFLIVLE